MFVKRVSTLYQLICFAIILSCAEAKMLSNLTKIECPLYYADLMHNLSCSINRTAQGTGTFAIEFSLTKDLHDVKGLYKLSIKRGSITTEYLSVKMDYCKTLASMQSNFLLRMFTTEVRRVSNIPMDCPFKKNTLYYIKDFTLNTNMIPSYAPKMDFISDTQINYMDKTALRAIVYGSLDRN